MADVKKFYNQNAKRYVNFEKVIDANPDDYKLLADLRTRENELLKTAENEKVFYFATGSGEHVVTLLEAGAKVVSIDFSEEMVNESRDLLESKGYNAIISKDTDFTAEKIDSLLKDEKDTLIIHGDYSKIKLPEGYFKYSFCYCTIPLLQDYWKEGLKRLLTLAPYGAISVYNADNIEKLKEYYDKAGFESYIEGNIIYKKGGFAYECLPMADISAIIKEKGNLSVENMSIGNIYHWSPKQ